MDGSLRVFNLRESDSVMQDASGQLQQAATSQGHSALHAESTSAGAWKLGFSPDGSEILSGQTSLFTLSIDDALKKNGEDIASS